MTKGRVDSWERRGLGEDDSDCRLSFVACSSSLPFFFFFWVKTEIQVVDFLQRAKKRRPICTNQLVWNILIYLLKSFGLPFLFPAHPPVFEF